MKALLVLVTRKLRSGEGPIIWTTDDQLRGIAADRSPDGTWERDNTQVRRLKSKFVSRLDRSGGGHLPAEREELLVEIRRGYRRPGDPVGEPSKYLVTGLYGLLAPADQKLFDQMNLPSTIAFEARPAEMALACTGASA